MERKKKHEELVLEAKEFFKQNQQAFKESLRSEEKVVKVSFEDLAQLTPNLAQSLEDMPEETLEILETELKESLQLSHRVRITNLPRSSEIKIREIRAKHLDKFISVEGIVRNASDVRPQVVNARFECPNCGAIMSVLQIESKFREPNRCSCGWKGEFKMLSKEMVDVQRLVIEESPESIEGGAQPRRISVFLKEDLVEPRMEDRTTPGSRVKVYGILKEIPVPLGTGAISTRYDIALEANNVIPMEETFEDLHISEEEERQILELSADEKVLHRLSESIAPSIYGLDKIKEAVLLQLFGGVKKKKSDGGSTRGDTHMLLVGDPGVAKSVLLKFVSRIAPKGRYVSGKSTSGAGLTATVVKDEFLRGWSLEAGAMVLANKGTVCVDEIEKMNENDRSSMHEAMEQQTVTISKANIHAMLRSESTVLAAGNPKLGRFDPYSPIHQQIDISPALLSRFDIIFVLKDIPNKSQDSAIASHVLEEHRQEVVRDIIEPNLLRKYISYAKQKIKPKLSEGAINEIRDFYVKMRNQPVSADSGVKPIAITARQLEGIIRLSEACAKVRLATEVSIGDAKKAIELIKSSLNQVGYDEESKTYDIDKITTGITSSKRGKIVAVREIIGQLEAKMGKLIPMEEVEKALEGKVTPMELDDAINQLTKSGDIFKPKPKFIQRL